jgi:hypothetical protein
MPFREAEQTLLLLFWKRRTEAEIVVDLCLFRKEPKAVVPLSGRALLFV